MQILETLINIKRGHWYEVPADFNANHYISVDSYEADMQLKHLAHHWTNLGVPTEFEFEPAQEMPIWDSVEKKMVIKPLIKVTMLNDRIKK